MPAALQHKTFAHRLVSPTELQEVNRSTNCAVSPTGNLPPRVGVVRDAFAAHDQEPRSLASSVAPLGQGSAAVASALSQSDSRQVVDEYEFGRDGQYHIKLVATDLLRCKTRRDEAPLLAPFRGTAACICSFQAAARQSSGMLAAGFCL